MCTFVYTTHLTCIYKKKSIKKNQWKRIYIHTQCTCSRDGPASCKRIPIKYMSWSYIEGNNKYKKKPERIHRLKTFRP